ncbi:MAG: hypothetical protein K2X48_09090 [Chitinophagaceae bacterium]|nr:hypothetical protein [Chitinophagaceae bacterium]
MQIDKLKKELMGYIENSNDEEFLSIVKEDFAFYGKVKGKDITDDLSEKQLNELKELSEEDTTKETITLGEFNKVTKRWRTK